MVALRHFPSASGLIFNRNIISSLQNKSLTFGVSRPLSLVLYLSSFLSPSLSFHFFCFIIFLSSISFFLNSRFFSSTLSHFLSGGIRAFFLLESAKLAVYFPSILGSSAPPPPPPVLPPQQWAGDALSAPPGQVWGELLVDVEDSKIQRVKDWKIRRVRDSKMHRDVVAQCHVTSIIRSPEQAEIFAPYRNQLDLNRGPWLAAELVATSSR